MSVRAANTTHFAQAAIFKKIPDKFSISADLQSRWTLFKQPESVRSEEICSAEARISVGYREGRIAPPALRSMQQHRRPDGSAFARGQSDRSTLVVA